MSAEGVRLTEAEEAYVEYCRTHGGAQTGVAGFRAGYEIGKALRVSPETPEPAGRAALTAETGGRNEGS